MNALVQSPFRAGRRWPKSAGVQALFIADWTEALFLHYKIPAPDLQPFVPYQLDLCEDHAFISLVAFTMRGMRLARFGRLGAWLCKPIATHEFLNLRTYVRCGEESGICFLSEWLPNRISLLFGPLLYSLPYRHASIRYSHDEQNLRGTVTTTRNGCYSYDGNLRADDFSECAKDSPDYFLLERYAAFNAGHSCLAPSRVIRRFFRVGHEPWRQTHANVQMLDDSLLRNAAPWWSKARYWGANYSPGARNVLMSAPRQIRP